MFHSVFLTFNIISVLLYFPLDIMSHSTFCPLTFCPVDVVDFNVLSVNHNCAFVFKFHGMFANKSKLTNHVGWWEPTPFP
jgi:hypothetical protein